VAPPLSRAQSEDIAQLYGEAAARNQQDADRDQRLLDFVHKAYREATCNDLPGDIAMSTILAVIAKRGSPLARAQAKAILAQMNTPERQAMERDFEAAVALDPYWEKLPDGSFTTRPGARYQTPEALVAAFRAAHPVKDRITADFVKLLDGVDPPGVSADADVDDKVLAALQELIRRYPEASGKDFDRKAMIGAWIAAAAAAAVDEIWNEPAELTEHRVGGAQLPEILDLPGDRKIFLDFATVGQWLAGPQPGGPEIGRILLERSGGDLAARILDHVDQEAVL
jgi:hypothetical protein